MTDFQPYLTSSSVGFRVSPNHSYLIVSEVVMKLSSRHRLAWLAMLLLAVSAVLVACSINPSPNPTTFIISPQLGEQITAQRAGQEVVAVAPAAAPKLADLTPDQITAGLSADLTAALAAANPENGKTISQNNGCLGCHSLDPNVQLAGPTWHNLGNTAVSRVAGESPALYLDTSVVNPSAFVVPNYPDGIMPKTFGESLTIQDQADIISFILSQTAE